MFYSKANEDNGGRMLTPWGVADHRQAYGKGFYWVSTPSHGGYMLGKRVAADLLSPAAVELGEAFGSYLCYEEDCAYAVVEYEIEELRNLVAEEELTWRKQPRSAGQIEADTRAVLLRWFPEYCRAVGLDGPAEVRCGKLRLELVAAAVRADAESASIEELEAAGDLLDALKEEVS